MERTRARWLKVLGKFNKSKLPEVADQLGFELPSKSSNKKELLSLLVDACLKAKLTPSDLLKLELSHFSSKPGNTTLWRAYKLEYSNAAPSLDSGAFSKRLQHYLGDFFEYNMAQVIDPSGCWFCLHIDDRHLVPYTCYVVRKPPSPFMFVAGVRKSHLPTLLEALSMAFSSVSCTDMKLTSKNLSSLVDLVSNQHSQGPLSSYRLNQVDPNPLLVAGRQIPLPLMPSSSSSSSSSRGERQDSQKRQEQEDKTQRAATEVFGSNPLPVLENFTFKLNANLPDKSDVITCQVKLVGSSVLEGTKAAIAADCFSLPVPDFIRKMPSFATNSLNVEQ